MGRINKKHARIGLLIALFGFAYLGIAPHFKTGGGFDVHYNGLDLDENFEKHKKKYLI